MKPDDSSKTNLRINHLQIIRLNSKSFVCILSFPQLANYYEHVVRVLHRYTLEEFLSLARDMDGNRLMKIQLTPSTLTDYQGYRHVLDNYTVKHIMHRHSGKRERLRGQEPITLEDLLLISDIVLHADWITPVQCKNGNPGYIYTKSINEETFTLIEEVRNGHSELAVTTLYKRKKKLTDAKSPE